MITRAELLMGRDSEYPLTPELEHNLELLLEAVNKLRALYGKPMFVSSGYRPGRFNVAAHGAPNSAHRTCEAVDFNDLGHAIYDFCTDAILEQCGLYKEDGNYTNTWTHVQIRPTKNRVFRP